MAEGVTQYGTTDLASEDISRVITTESFVAMSRSQVAKSFVLRTESAVELVNLSCTSRLSISIKKNHSLSVVLSR